jgi:hypothetical protein
VAGAVRCRRWFAVVEDCEVELAVAVADLHPRARGPCVLADVRQSFLDDPVRRQVDTGRETPTKAAACGS